MIAIAVATCAAWAGVAEAQQSPATAPTPAPASSPTADVEGQAQTPGQPTAAAAASDPAETAPGDIIVTAQKRAENLQDVPLAVTAFTAQTLEAKGIHGLSDFVSVPPPGLSVQQFSGSSQALILDIRGISNSDPGQGTLELGVAVYLDDVYLGRAQGLGTDLADPERIEVLRGPQGTLFGRNAEGGALRIISRKPTGEFGGRIKGTLGEYGQQRVEAHVDLPEIAGFSFKVDYVNSHLDGYTRNGPGRVAGLGQQKDFGYDDSDGYRGSVRWKPIDAITVDYAYDHSTSRNVGDLWHFQVPNDPPPGYVPPTSVLDLTENPQSVHHRTRETASTWFNEPFLTKTYGHTLSAEYDASDTITVKTITAWRGTDSSGSQNLTQNYTVVPFEFVPGIGGPLPAAAFAPDPRYGSLGTVSNPLLPVYGVTGLIPYAAVRQRQFSQEVQLLGSTDTLKWVVGGYYFRERVRDTRQTFFSALYTDTATDGGFSQIITTNPFSLPFPGQGATSQTSKSRSYAAFAQVTWSPNFADGRLHITPGLRYTNDRKNALRDLDAGVPVAIPANFKESRVDPALIVAYDITPDANLFARYAQAYRAGGAGVRDPLFRSFGSEVNKAYEIGLKTRLFDHHATINLAGFYNDVRGRQLTVQVDPTDPAQTRVINAPGSSPVWGIEVEANARILQGLSVGATYVYQDGDLDEQALAAIDPTGKFYIQNLPRNSGTFTVDYLTPDLGFGKIALHGDYAWADKWNGTVRVPYDAYAWKLERNVANVRVALQDVQVGPVAVTIAGFVKNVFNAAYPVYNSPSSDAVLLAPRLAGVEVGVNF